MRYDVSVIGLYILDVLGRPVTRIPDRGNVDCIEEIRLTVAGTAGGTVIDTAKLGLKSLAVGAVGDDEKADWVLMTMQKHGIDTSAMQRLKGIPTSATILNVRPNGDRPALHVRGASDHFDVPPSMYDQVFDAPIIHLGGTGLLKKLDGPASVTLLKEAKARGRTVTFDLIAASAETIGIVGPLFTGSFEAVERLRAPVDCFKDDAVVAPGFRERLALRNRAAQRRDRVLVAPERTEFVAQVAPCLGENRLQLQRPAIGLFRVRVALELLLRKAQLEPAERAAAGARDATLECLGRQCIRARLRMQVADRHPNVGLRRVHRDRLLQAGHGLFPVAAGLFEQAEQVQHPRAARLRVEERTVGAARRVELARIVQPGRFGQRWPGTHDAAPAT